MKRTTIFAICFSHCFPSICRPKSPTSGKAPARVAECGSCWKETISRRRLQRTGIRKRIEAEDAEKKNGQTSSFETLEVFGDGNMVTEIAHYWAFASSQVFVLAELSRISKCCIFVANSQFSCLSLNI